ncbi:MAG: VOC family protein [Actinomycetota bacterium]|nr:VOC family protein [Actinomycetota bacterium]
MVPALAELVVADEPGSWSAAGFTVDDDGVCRIATVRVRLVGPVFNGTRGIQGWALRGVDDGSIDGLVTVSADDTSAHDTTGGSAAEPSGAPVHPNGVTSIDHVVVGTDDCDRTVRAFRMFGLEPRRTRRYEMNGRPMRQVFFRAGEVIVELVGADAPDPADTPTRRPRPATFWGLAHVVADIDATAAFLGDLTSAPKDAVQPGRRISTLDNHRLEMSVRTAFLSPRPPRPTA